MSPILFILLMLAILACFVIAWFESVKTNKARANEINTLKEIRALCEVGDDPFDKKFPSLKVAKPKLDVHQLEASIVEKVNTVLNDRVEWEKE